jgi:hypothetical protein
MNTGNITTDVTSITNYSPEVSITEAEFAVNYFKKKN